MKKRNFGEIRFTDNNDGTLTLEHLVGEIKVPCTGGGYVLGVPCGAGKSTAVTSLVNLFPSEGFVILEKTQQECNEAMERLITAGVKREEILLLHSNTPDYDLMHKTPEWVTTFRVVITPSINLYTNFLPTLLAYDCGRKVDLRQYAGNIDALTTSDKVRKFVLIDEAPEFIKHFASFDGMMVSSVFATYNRASNELIPLTPTDTESYYWNKGYRWMELFTKDTPLTRLKALEVFTYIADNLSDIENRANCEMYTTLNKIISAPNLRTNIYILDATGGVLSNYKKSKFELLENSDRSYCSDVTFERFEMNIRRWKHSDKADESTINKEIIVMADELVRQMGSIDGELLIVTWLDMQIQDAAPEVDNKKHIDIVALLDEELKSRNMAGRYSIIYRGSGDDKATNKFASYAAVTFLGDWACGKENVARVNRNLGIKSKVDDHMLANLIQTVSRIRIRNHNGEPIHIFYSSDINPKWVYNLYSYFESNGSGEVTSMGLPITNPAKNEVSRKINFVNDLVMLYSLDGGLFDAVMNRKPHLFELTLTQLKRLKLRAENKTKSYRPLIKWLYEEYQITLKIIR
ncbi:MAG: hypothetical protein SNI45_03935 [Rikenellaceae bacterium]